MNESDKIILLKLTGNVLINQNKEIDLKLLSSIAKQIESLKNQFRFAIVIGGGNIFRGNEKTKKLGIKPNIGHQVGMLATVINGLLIKHCFEENGLNTQILSSIESNFAGKFASQDNIDEALKNNKIIIFVAGIGNPYFSTDTASVVRCLQINSNQIWKATNVDGAYDKDPKLNADAKFLETLSFNEAINQNLNIMDLSAFVLAKQNSLKIRIFNIFEKDALIKVAKNNNFGSLVS